LDLSKTEIILEDLPALSKLQNLKELHISAEESKEYIAEKISILKQVVPNCRISVNNETYH
jgi:hypothetical protein